MKKIIYILAITGLIFGACDKIEEPFLEETGSTGSGPDTTLKIRKILLEEFTGHICVNCPEATALARDLKTIYGDQLILMSIHAGYLSVPLAAPYDADYRSETGTAIFNYYNPVGVPIGMVNRTPYNGSTLMFSGEWEAAIQALINKPMEANIDIETEYNDANRQLDIHVHSEFLADLGHAVNLSVIIIESGMISAQKNDLASVGDVPDILDYEHNHVLRQGVNGTWGELLDANPVNGTVMTKDFSLSLNSAWNEENISVVAMIINADNYEVIQTEEAHIN